MASVGTVLAGDGPEPARCWRVDRDVPGYARSQGDGLATEVAAGRRFRLRSGSGLPLGLDGQGSTRIPVVLLEDGYPCWLSLNGCRGHVQVSAPFAPRLLSIGVIRARLQAVLDQALIAMDRPHHYLWGGTTGPGFDCSGLVQSAFASQGIWLPRDAYQQERFCRPVAVRPGVFPLLRPADLIFFGTPQRCTHVGLHLGGGRYLHSSGREHGRDGIGIDTLVPRDRHPVASHYRHELRGAGRVERCHDGTTLP